jgi:hypothetical protein
MWKAVSYLSVIVVAQFFIQSEKTVLPLRMLITSCLIIVIYEPSAKRHFSRMRAIYFHSFEIFNIQIAEMTFCKPEFIKFIKLLSECSKRRMIFG